MPEVVKDAAAAPSTAKPAEGAKEPAAVEPDIEESDTDEDEDSDTPPKGDLHKSKRWQKVHGELKEFKQFQMSPLELQAALVRLAKLEKKEAAAVAAEGETDEDKELTAKRKSARKELSRISPEIDQIKEIGERTQVLFDSLERRAVRETTRLMKEAGLSTTEKNLDAMVEVLSGTIAGDTDLYDDFITDPKGAVVEAFKRFTSGIETAAVRAAKASTQREKTKLLGLPKAHKAGGAVEVPKNRVEGPKNLIEARKSAEARLAALEE